MYYFIWTRVPLVNNNISRYSVLLFYYLKTRGKRFVNFDVLPCVLSDEALTIEIGAEATNVAAEEDAKVEDAWTVEDEEGGVSLDIEVPEAEKSTSKEGMEKITHKTIFWICVLYTVNCTAQ